MTEQTGSQEALKLAQDVLSKTDKEKFPKLHEARELAVKGFEIANNQELRAKKAETKPKKVKTEKDTPKQPGYSLKDIRALSDIHDDDVDEVVDYAKNKGISVAEAKKAPLIQSFLRDSNEIRKTADATNTGTTKRGAKKTSGAELLKKFEETGEVPENKADLDRMLSSKFPTPKKIGT